MIVDSGNQAVNMEIHCPQCHDTANIKAEINVINHPQDIAKIAESGTIMTQMMSTEKTITEPLVEKLIQDEDILQLRNRLKQTASVEDLFN